MNMKPQERQPIKSGFSENEAEAAENAMRLDLGTFSRRLSVNACQHGQVERGQVTLLCWFIRLLLLVLLVLLVASAICSLFPRNNEGSKSKLGCIGSSLFPRAQLLVFQTGAPPVG